MAFIKSLLDAASSPALSLVTNGHHFRVPNHINVSSGTGLPAYVILPAQFSASKLPPPPPISLSLHTLCLSRSLPACLMWCDVAWLPSSHPLVWVTGEAERYLVCWTIHTYTSKTRAHTHTHTHTHSKRQIMPPLCGFTGLTVSVWCLLLPCEVWASYNQCLRLVSIDLCYGKSPCLCSQQNLPFFNPLPPCRATSSNPCLLLSLYKTPQSPTLPSLPAWKSLIHQYFDFLAGIIDHCRLSFSAIRKNLFLLFPSLLAGSPLFRPLLISTVCDTYTGASGDEWSNPCG